MFVDPWGLKAKGEVFGLGGGSISDVKILQINLNLNNIKGADGNQLKVDGIFGDNTLYAVKKYQSDNGLKVDGLVGDETWESLQIASSGKLPSIGEPNSVRELYNPDGTVKQRREYDEHGRAKKDTDYNHGGVGHVFPHEHEWDWSKPHPRQPDKQIDDTLSTAVRTGMVISGAIVIIGTLIEDIGTGGAGIANDIQMFQEGWLQIQQAFK